MGNDQEAFVSTNGGSGPISYREAITVFATKADIAERFADLKEQISSWRKDSEHTQADMETRLRKIEGRQLPGWLVAGLWPVATAMGGWLLRGVPHF